MNNILKNHSDTFSKFVIVLCVFLILLLLQQFQDSLIFDRAEIASGEVWRLWSGQFVHTNNNHLLMNTLAIAMLILMYKESLPLLRLLIQTAYLATCIGIGIYFISPDILKYAGLSGVTYGLFAMSSLFFIYKKDYLLGHFVFFAITIKIVWENMDSSINDSSAMLINASIATDAHLYGYLSALFFSAVYITLNRKKQ